VPSAQGWGYATEVMTALFGWADQKFPQVRRTCLIDPDNLASIRVAQRFGFTQLARVSYQGEPSIIFERAAPSGQ
jgi:RimJ/RimL family protein N-acetyltransferase